LLIDFPAAVSRRRWVSFFDAFSDISTLFAVSIAFVAAGLQLAVFQSGSSPRNSGSDIMAAIREATLPGEPVGYHQRSILRPSSSPQSCNSRKPGVSIRMAPSGQ